MSGHGHTHLALVIGIGALVGGAAVSPGSVERDQQAAPTRVGELAGVVRLAGDFVLSPTRVENTTDPQACGRSHLLDDLVVQRGSGGLAHVIVALEGPSLEQHTVAGQPRRLVLDNRKCRFVPHTAVLTVGSVIETVNRDPVLHTVHLYGPLDVNIGLPVRGVTATRLVDRPGIIIVKCDVHGWMQAFIRVDSHPFHAITDASGAFRISGIPVGDYTLTVWQERLGEQKRPVTISAGRPAQVKVTYTLGG